jgi:alkylation response protein AidB-like acyl-CoA dehydrogenase
LGFAAGRLCDEFPPRPGRQSNPAADVLCAASKLFSTAQAGSRMREIASLVGECGIADFVHYKCIDAQLEAIYLGPEAIERRQIAAACVDEIFLRQFRAWTDEMEQISVSRPDLGALPLATAMAAWRWTLDYLRQTTDASGGKLYADVRQSITFPMADALSWLLAARALILDVLELEPAGSFADLSFVQAARAAGEVGRICDRLVFGTRPQGAATEDLGAFTGMRRRMEESLQAGERY